MLHAWNPLWIVQKCEINLAYLIFFVFNSLEGEKVNTLFESERVNKLKLLD